MAAKIGCKSESPKKKAFSTRMVFIKMQNMQIALFVVSDLLCGL